MQYTVFNEDHAEVQKCRANDKIQCEVKRSGQQTELGNTKLVGTGSIIRLIQGQNYKSNNRMNKLLGMLDTRYVGNASQNMNK